MRSCGPVTGAIDSRQHNAVFSFCVTRWYSVMSDLLPREEKSDPSAQVVFPKPKHLLWIVTPIALPQKKGQKTCRARPCYVTQVSFSSRENKGKV